MAVDTSTDPDAGPKRYTIGRLAARTGFTTSALRYYEGHGLLTPVARSAAGYRLYDDTSEARLRFLARAKHLGCSLDEIAELLALAERDDCSPVQARLHDLVTDRIVDVDRRRAELVTFAAQLREAAASLGGEPVDGPCRTGCACLEAAEAPADPEIACTLPADAVDDRLADWRRLLGFVVAHEPVDGGIRLALDACVPGDELLRLTTAEQSCCAFFAFAITVDGRGLALEVRAPDAGADLVAAMFASAG
jgi:DNA-binding transcriptional MerR regulator